MEIDGNYKGMDGDYREIDLIQGSHPPQRKREIKRERDALMHQEIGLFFIHLQY